MANSKKIQKKKVFGIRKKIMLTVVPLLIFAFTMTAVLIFLSSRQIILSNAKRTLIKESESNAKTVTITIISATSDSNIRSAYSEIVRIPSRKEYIYNSVKSMSVMDDGYAFLVDTTDFSIIAHSDESLTGTVITEYPEGTFLGDIGTHLLSKNTELFTAVDNFQNYYVIASYINDTPWVLVSCISHDYILTDLTRLFLIIIGVFTVILIIVIVMINLILHSTLSPISTLTDALTTITDGDFSVDIPEKGNDEITLMSRSLNGFVSIMREIIMDIRDISNQLDELSNSSKHISGALNQAAENQADSMGDMEVTLDQVASGIHELALHATTLSGIVNETNERGGNAKANMELTVNVASSGCNDMEAINQAMDSIVQSMKQLSNIVEKVGDSTKQINSMVAIISDISDQTELLSLNAAIEAASAGEAGKGFAVVAEEIRKLADISSSSASQISEIITQINDQVAYMVSHTEQSVKYIEENSGKITSSREIFEKIYSNVSETDRILSEIVDQIAHVDDVATNIAALSEEQSANTEEILSSTEMLANSALQFSSDSKEVAQGADHVSDAAFALAEHMRKFKI